MHYGIIEGNMNIHNLSIRLANYAQITRITFDSSWIIHEEGKWTPNIEAHIQGLIQDWRPKKKGGGGEVKVIWHPPPPPNKKYPNFQPRVLYMAPFRLTSNNPPKKKKKKKKKDNERQLKQSKT